MLRHHASKRLGSAASAALFSSGVRRELSSTAVLPDLPYDYAALEPCISAEIMELHHSKHHQTYVNNVNTALEKYAEAETKGDISAMISLQGAIKFNGGGHLNHSIFWTNLCPAKDYDLPQGNLATAINNEFGSLEDMQDLMTARCLGIQGSGWGWLAYNKTMDRLCLTTCANQDPVSMQGLIPLLGCDMWEHAMYLQYKNAKPAYLKEFWKVVNWKNVEERYNASRSAK